MMITRAVKHFFVVGVLSSLALGWILTLVVNTALGNGIEALAGKSTTESYWFALLLTLVSLSLIVSATTIGGRLFRARVHHVSLARSERLISSALFLGVVLVFVVPEFSEIFGRFMTHMSYTYEHPTEAWQELSLPLLRLLVLPLAYYVVAGHAADGNGSDDSDPVGSAIERR